MAHELLAHFSLLHPLQRRNNFLRFLERDGSERRGNGRAPSRATGGESCRRDPTGSDLTRHRYLQNASLALAARSAKAHLVQAVGTLAAILYLVFDVLRPACAFCWRLAAGIITIG
eukprot:6927047-Prymnesium_polylepis.1